MTPSVPYTLLGSWAGHLSTILSSPALMAHPPILPGGPKAPGAHGLMLSGVCLAGYLQGMNAWEEREEIRLAEEKLVCDSGPRAMCGPLWGSSGSEIPLTVFPHWVKTSGPLHTPDCSWDLAALGGVFWREAALCS